jgi:hypothetical protein
MLAALARRGRGRWGNRKEERVAEGKKEREREKINYLVSFKSLLKASSF